MNLVVDTSGNVLMYSEIVKPDVPDGCSLVSLDDEQAKSLIELTETKNSGLVFKDGQISAKPHEEYQEPSVGQSLVQAVLSDPSALAELKKSLGIV
jgi:hypothetical protein